MARSDADEAQLRRVGKGATAPCPPFSTVLVMVGTLALCPPYRPCPLRA